MRELAENLWVAEQPLRFGVIELGARMTVMRLADSSIVLHSPISLTDSLKRELDSIGTVRDVIAPNRFHHLFVGDYSAAYPESALYVAPGLPEKRADLTITGVLPADGPAHWDGELKCVFFEGLPLANEVVVLHEKTRTLLLCDLAFNIGPDAPWLTRMNFRLLGRYNEFGPTVFERLLVRNREAARKSLEQILDLDFDRVVVSHGDVLASGGPSAMRHGFDWLLEKS
jgi:hypothetical protein